MAATAQATKNQITLKGSVATVTEFFQHALSSILYQRGIYGPESFEPKKAYGLTVMAVKDDKLTAYLQAVLQQFSSEWSGRGVSAAGAHMQMGATHYSCCWGGGSAMCLQRRVHAVIAGCRLDFALSWAGTAAVGHAQTCFLPVCLAGLQSGWRAARCRRWCSW